MRMARVLATAAALVAVPAAAACDPQAVASPAPSVTVTSVAPAAAATSAPSTIVATSKSPAAKAATGFVYPAPGQYATTGKLPAAAAGNQILGEQATNLGGFGQPGDWIPLTKAEQDSGGVSRYAMGGTNVVGYAPGKAVVYYLKNDRQGGVNRLLGAGVATVTVTGSSATAARQKPVHSVNTTADKDTLLWNKDDPWYGDIGVTYDPRDKKIYAWGNGPDSGVYLARVPAARADDVDAYEYWDQSKQQWYTGVKKVGRNQAIFSHHYDTPFAHGEIFSQSNAFWSNRYNTWMFVTSGDYLGKSIAVMTAPKLEGPWTKLTKLSDACPATDGIVCYAVAPHPEYDPGGKTLLVTYTQVDQRPGQGTMKIITRRITFM